MRLSSLHLRSCSAIRINRRTMSRSVASRSMSFAAKRGRSFRVGDRVKIRIEEVDLVAMEVLASVVAR